MRPYISCLCVDPEYGLEARPERVERWSVSFNQEVIIPQPFGQMIMVNDGPAGLPDSARYLLSLIIGTTG